MKLARTDSSGLDGQTGPVVLGIPGLEGRQALPMRLAFCVLLGHWSLTVWYLKKSVVLQALWFASNSS